MWTSTHEDGTVPESLDARRLAVAQRFLISLVVLFVAYLAFLYLPEGAIAGICFYTMIIAGLWMLGELSQAMIIAQREARIRVALYHLLAIAVVGSVAVAIVGVLKLLGVGV